MKENVNNQPEILNNPKNVFRDLDRKIKTSEMLRDGPPPFFGAHLFQIVELFHYFLPKQRAFKPSGSRASAQASGMPEALLGVSLSWVCGEASVRKPRRTETPRRASGIHETFKPTLFTQLIHIR